MEELLESANAKSPKDTHDYINMVLLLRKSMQLCMLHTQYIIVDEIWENCENFVRDRFKSELARLGSFYNNREMNRILRDVKTLDINDGPIKCFVRLSLREAYLAENLYKNLNRGLVDRGNNLKQMININDIRKRVYRALIESYDKILKKNGYEEHIKDLIWSVDNCKIHRGTCAIKAKRDYKEAKQLYEARA